MVIFLTYVGVDDWHRKVYKDQHGYYYKTYEDKPEKQNLYTASDFYGEPSFPLSKNVEVMIMD